MADDTPAPEAPPEAPVEEPAPEPEPAAEPEPEAAPAPEALGDAGKRALSEERKARKDAEKQLKNAQTELATLREAQMTEQEKAVADARREGETDATTRLQRQLFAAEAKVAAAGKVADPSLLSDPDVALKLLGFNEIPVTDGAIDAEAISEAIDGLVQVRPYLAPAPAGATRPTGNPDNGARGNNGPPQLARDDLRTMTPEEITKARADGRLSQLLGKT